MREKLLIAVAALLMSVTASYAGNPPITDGVTGDFGLSYSGLAGGSSGMSFSSSPGEVNNLGGVPPGYTNGADLGTNSMSGQVVGPTPPTLLTTSNGNPFNLGTLTVGTPVSVNFFTANPQGSCNGCGVSSLPVIANTAISGNSSSGGGYATANNIAYGTITANFAFITPSGATGALSATGTYAANYNGSLTCAGTTFSSQADCVVWSTAGDPIMVSFSDGATMTVTLNNAADWDITPTVTFDLTRGMNSQYTSAPEPASLAIFGTAVAGLGWVRRRRKAG